MRDRNQKGVVVACMFFLALTLVILDAGRLEAGYPDKPVKVISYQKPGGAVDTTTRIMASFAQEKLNVPFVVESMVGSGGRRSFTKVYNESPDGYTIMTAGIPSIALGQVVYNAAYDSKKFTYISTFVDTGYVLSVKEDSPIKDFKDFVETLKKKRVTIGTIGSASSAHLQILILIEALKTPNAALVHFDGGAPSMTALVGGHIDSAITGYGAFARTNRVRPLAVFAAGRTPDIDAPTLKELGHDIPVYSQMWGMVGPPGMAMDKVKVLEKVCMEAGKDEKVKELFKKLELVPINYPSEKFTELAIGAYESALNFKNHFEKK